MLYIIRDKITYHSYRKRIRLTNLVIRKVSLV